MTDRPARSPSPPLDAPGLLADARAIGRLVANGVVGVADLVEGVHRAVMHLAPPFGTRAPARTRGLTGFVYRRVRGTTRAVGWGLDAALTRLEPLFGSAAETPQRDRFVAALNGVLGDHLVATGNPLATPMHVRSGGRPLALAAAGFDAAGVDAASVVGIASEAPHPRRLLVLVHGLCMDESGWLRHGHDHGAALARDLGYTPLYLRYNTGLSVAENGRALADLLDRLAAAWPVPLDELVLFGHSMGGLVARSACHVADGAGLGWLASLRALATLGTPYHGSPLERAGRLVDLALGASAYSAPFVRIGALRSAGIQDLRYGAVRHGDDAEARGSASLAPLPSAVRWIAVAASRDAIGAGDSAGPCSPAGDGLVPVESALGRRLPPTLAPTESGRAVCFGTDHFGLLNSRAAYAHVRDGLGRS